MQYRPSMETIPRRQSDGSTAVESSAAATSPMLLSEGSVLLGVAAVRLACVGRGSTLRAFGLMPREATPGGSLDPAPHPVRTPEDNRRHVTPASTPRFRACLPLTTLSEAVAMPPRGSR